MKMHRVFICVLPLILTAGNCIQAQERNPFATFIRPTPKLTPEQEQATFTLPPGFEIQLFASEPDIAKPLNMAFDARGRLWITDTVEYPYAAPADRPGRDSVKILEDTNGDGRADKITTFADGLNIPIGIYPYRDGAIVFSIPHIWRLRDTNGDGKADKREKLFGPMGYDRDTHGLNNAFRRGFDGWLYACHGFSNNTTVTGADGHTVKMSSGNTYRMRLDGSRIEQYTWGQVNPFGMVIDERGNIFTADCHSKPIYQLLRGAYYPSFGKPHDGLGFVPPMMEHGHGSTAIAGVAVYDAPNFPEEYRGNLFTGNVMTSRVNRDSLVYHGSTILAHEEPDFLTTTDPWFRPVDVQLGPDGALYVADFYNRIIGHYEVALDHPGRDRDSGRIWRIVYTGKDAQSAESLQNLAEATTEELIATLGDDNLTRRMLAMNILADERSSADEQQLRSHYRASKAAQVRSRLLWILHRRGMVREDDLQSAAADLPEVRLHAMKVLSEIGEWTEPLRTLALAGLNDGDPFVQRAAADALGQHPHARHIQPLLELLPKIPGQDNHLRHVVRMALRNQLRVPENLTQLEGNLNDVQRREIAALCRSIHSPAAGAFLVKYLADQGDSAENVAENLEHAARYVPEGEIDRLVELSRATFSNDVDRQSQLLMSLHAGLQQRGVAATAAMQDWAQDVALKLLESTREDGPSWTYHPLPRRGGSHNAFGIRRLPFADGKGKAPFIDSKAGGEQATGILRSPEFELPGQLTFYLSGHLGPPQKPAVQENFVRLRDAANNKVLKQALPPRHDVARKVDWDLKEFAGRRAYLEIVDGLNQSGYAWLAAGRFDPAVVKLPKLDPAQIIQRQTVAARLTEQFNLRSLESMLAKDVLSSNTDANVRAAMSRALVALSPDSRIAALTTSIGNPTVSSEIRDRVCRVVVDRTPGELQKVFADLLRVLPRRPQEELAEALSADKSGVEMLLQLIEAGQATPQLLRNPTVQQRIAKIASTSTKKRVQTLTADLPPAGQQTEREIRSRRRDFNSGQASATRGRQVFEKNCSICHQIGKLGKVVGPQLDGIGNRGLERVIEDMLDPNRNVDQAFRTTTLFLVNGKAVSGLLRREEGALLVLTNTKGEEVKVPKRDVEERVVSRTSLMPEGLTKDYSKTDFNDLLAFLLEQRSTATKSP